MRTFGNTQSGFSVGHFNRNFHYRRRDSRAYDPGMFLCLLLSFASADDPHREALARYGAGVLKQKRDEFPSAKKQLESAVARDPAAAEPKRALFHVYVDLACYSAAVRTGREVLDRDPDDFKTALALGRVLLEGKQPREAAEVLTKAVASRTLASDASTAVDVYANLATAHERARDFAKAEAVMVSLTTHHTKNVAAIRKSNHWSEREHAVVAGMAWERLGLLRVARALPVEAASAFFEAEKLFSGPGAFPVGAARLNRNLARAFAATGDHAKALEQFRKYLASNPPGLEPLTEYADLLHAAGKDKDAAEEFTRLLATNPRAAGSNGSNSRRTSVPGRRTRDWRESSFRIGPSVRRTKTCSASPSPCCTDAIS